MRAKKPAGRREITPQAVEYQLVTPQGVQVIVVCPPELLAAYEELRNTDEGSDIVRSAADCLDVFLERMADRRNLRFKKLVEPRLLPTLQLRKAKKKFMEAHPASDLDLDQFIRELTKERWNPALREEVVRIAGDPASVLLLDKEGHELLIQAVHQAWDARDDGFFIKLGAAFARARKAQKHPKEAPRSLFNEPVTPHIEFLAQWWITGDGQGPQLCLFTDQATADFLANVFDDDDRGWLDIVRKVKRRYGLVSASKRVICRVEHRQNHKLCTERITLHAR